MEIKEAVFELGTLRTCTYVIVSDSFCQVLIEELFRWRRHKHIFKASLLLLRRAVDSSVAGLGGSLLRGNREQRRLRGVIRGKA